MATLEVKPYRDLDEREGGEREDDTHNQQHSHTVIKLIFFNNQKRVYTRSKILFIIMTHS